MGLYRDRGVVVRTIKLGEADRIVSVITQTHGKVRAVAKGVRKTKSRYGGRLEPLRHLDLQFYEGRGDLDIVTQAETRDHWPAVRDDLDRLGKAMTLAEVLAHMLVLAEWVDRTLERGLAEGEVERSRPEPPPPTVDGLRRRTLEALLSVRARLEGADDERLVTVEITASRSRGPQPFWSLINGPLADFLTHVGQVAAWRRQAGSPAPRADVFRGEPPGSPDGDG